MADQDKKDHHVTIPMTVDGLEQVAGVLLQPFGCYAPAAEVDRGQRKWVDMVVPGLQVQAPDEALPCCLQMILCPLQLHCQTCEEGEDVQLPVAANSHSVALDGSY